jgi:hypothetical protein
VIDLARLAPHLQRKLHTATPPERFRLFALLLEGAAYEPGRENIFATDCSGTICWPLFCMGFNLRLTAAELFAQVFTHHVDLAYIKDFWEHCYAVFYERAGTVSHVAPIVGRGVILDAVDREQPVMLKAADPVLGWYRDHGYGFYFREIDWERARSLADHGPRHWEREADDMLLELLGLNAVGVS